MRAVIFSDKWLDAGVISKVLSGAAVTVYPRKLVYADNPSLDKYFTEVRVDSASAISLTEINAAVNTATAVL